MDTSQNVEQRKQALDDEAQRRWELRGTKDNHVKVMVAIRVRDARRRMGITQKELSKKMRDAGYTTWTPVKVSRFEKGEQDLKLNEAWTLSVLLGCRIEDFLPPIKLTPELFPQRYVAGAPEPVCCVGECCGPGSYCCVNAGPHEHEEAK